DYLQHTIQGRVVSVIRLTIVLRVAIIICLWLVVVLLLMLFDSVGNASVMNILVLHAIVLNVPPVTVTTTICFVPVHSDEVVGHPRQGNITISFVRVLFREARHVATEDRSKILR
ncbi:hypothetical protein V3C99_002720, partial [Haemonchus contortus]